MGVRVLAPAYYAREQMRAPARMAVLAVALNGVLSLALMDSLGHVGVALATSVAASANAVLLLFGLIRDGSYRPTPGWGRFAVSVLAAGGAMGLVLGNATPDLPDWIAMDQGQRAGLLPFWMLVGAAVYATTLWVSGVRPRNLRERAV
jgi:putative peptidoglycan lipid II flippase